MAIMKLHRHKNVRVNNRVSKIDLIINFDANWFLSTMLTNYQSSIMLHQLSLIRVVRAIKFYTAKLHISLFIP